MTSDKIRLHHLQRKALFYVRQSSAHQVLHNRESSALQYAMRDRLSALGGPRSRLSMTILAVPLQAGRRLRADGGASVPRQGWRRRRARGLASPATAEIGSN